MSHDNAVEVWRQTICDRLLDHRLAHGPGSLLIEAGDRIIAYFGINPAHKPLLEKQLSDKELFVKALGTLVEDGTLEGGLSDTHFTDYTKLDIRFTVAEETTPDVHRQRLAEIDALLEELEGEKFVGFLANS